MAIPLTQTEHRGLVRRVRHALDHRHRHLRADEFSFLMSIDHQLREIKKMALSERQLSWLLSILERLKSMSQKKAPVKRSKR